MISTTDNLLFQYALIACLAVALILGQFIKLHMHIDHDESFSSTKHTLDIHVASSLHDTTQDTHHQGSFQDHHLADIEVSPDSVVKKIESFTPHILLFLFAIFFLGIPRIDRAFRQYVLTKITSTYYLFSPPLRAPPVFSFA